MAATITDAECATIINKAHLNITSTEYGHFKFESTFKSLMRDRTTEFAKKGETEKAAVDKLNALFEKFDKEHLENDYFKSEEDYQTMKHDFVKAVSRGDAERIKKIIELVDLRRLPLSEGYSHMMNTPQIRALSGVYWSPLLFLVYHKQVAEEQIIETIKSLIAMDFNLR